LLKLCEPFLLRTCAGLGLLAGYGTPIEAQCDLQHARRAVQETEAKTNAIAGELIRLRAYHSDDVRNGTAAEKVQLVLRQLTALTSQCRISILELPRCEMKGQDAERLAGVLAQCPALAHLDLSGNLNFGAAGAENVAGVLGQCSALAHLDLAGNKIGETRAESFTGVLSQC
jgi:hypothetical protein